MKSAIYMNGNKFDETVFSTEEAFEKIVKDNSKTLFGNKSIYFDVKSRVDSKTFGSAIPDGFLFDFREEASPEFYLVEVELQRHDFYNHIFPQITKFFAFFKNPASRNNLIERLHTYIRSNAQLEQEFKVFLKGKEIYKALKDVVENSQNIMIILDDVKPEMQEVFDTYTDTWDRMVKVEILKQYAASDKVILALSPDFEEIEIAEVVPHGKEAEETEYTESYHLENVERGVSVAYQSIKNGILAVDSSIKVNPQRHYISLRKNRNFAYLIIRKNRIEIVAMVPFVSSGRLIRKHKVTQLSESVQRFYNGACFKIVVEDNQDVGEVIEALKEAYNLQA